MDTSLWSRIQNAEAGRSHEADILYCHSLSGVVDLMNNVKLRKNRLFVWILEDV